MDQKTIERRTRGLGKMDEATQRKDYDDLMRQHMSIRTNYALMGIKKTDERGHCYGDPFDYGDPPDIECKLHRIVFNGPYCSYPDLKNQLGSLKEYNPSKADGYQKHCLSNVPGFYRSVATWPINYRSEPTRIELVPRRRIEPKEHKRALIDLMYALPRLQPSEVEYAIDIRCRFAENVVDLFDLFSRYLWVPSKKHVSLGGSQVERGKDGRMNRILHFKSTNAKKRQKNRANAKMKLYERGPDDRKVGKCWPLVVCDGLRSEQTVRRPRLLRYSIDTLYDLIEHPMFWALNEKIYRFEEFKGKLPKPWEYSSFQTEYWRVKGLGYNMGRGQSTIDCRQLIPLRTALIDAMKSFDREWEMA